jgi:esterase FrsA
MIARFLVVLTSFAVLSTSSLAQQHSERAIEEIKTEAIKRAENGMYPLIGLDPADVREAFASIHSKDKDEWAAAFMAVGDRYMAEENNWRPRFTELVGRVLGE